MTAAIDVIASSLRIIGAASRGETIGSAKLAEGLLALNMMLGGWSNAQNNIYFATEDTLTLTASDGEYTIGTGGDIATARPTKILNAFIRDSNNDYPLEIIDRAKYDSLVYKVSTGLPQYLYYEPTVTTGTIKLYPEPDSAYVLHLKSNKPFKTDYVGTDTMTLPPGYLEAIKYNLAVRLSPEYGKPVSQELVALASGTLTSLKRLNATYRVVQIASNPFGGGRSSDIESDT